jgi:hypothetical protein
MDPNVCAPRCAFGLVHNVVPGLSRFGGSKSKQLALGHSRISTFVGRAEFDKVSDKGCLNLAWFDLAVHRMLVPFCIYIYGTIYIHVSIISPVVGFVQ